MKQNRRLRKIEARADAIAAQVDEEAAIEFAIARFSSNIISRIIIARPEEDGSCPPGWRPTEDGRLCQSPPLAAYDLRDRKWKGCRVLWDAALGEWVGDAHIDPDLDMWVVSA
jgi:hypothetical protein